MPAPSVATYSAAVLIAVHTELRDLIDAGAGAGLIRIRDAADVLLAEFTLDDPCGTVNGTTGQLTITVDVQEASANASGTAAYGEICTSDGTVRLALPAQAGSSPVSGKIVLNTLTITSGGPVNILSVTIG
jgi:Flp pilus assembly protein TadG